MIGCSDLMSGIQQCNKCLLYRIEEETHVCVLDGINYVKHCQIDSKWYIDEISKNGSEWQKIDPIPSFMEKEAIEDIL